MTPAGMAALHLVELETLTQYVCDEACARANTSNTGSSEKVENRTHSTSSSRYSMKNSGKLISIHSAAPKRKPSTSNVSGVNPGVYQPVISVFEHQRLSYRPMSRPSSEITYRLLCGRFGGGGRLPGPSTRPSPDSA